MRILSKLKKYAKPVAVLAVALMVLVSTMTMTAQAADEKKDASFYKLASAASAHLNNCMADDSWWSSGIDVSGISSGDAGGLLGYCDEADTDGLIKGWITSALSMSSVTYSYESVASVSSQFWGFSSPESSAMYQYCRLGYLLSTTGLDSTGTTSGSLWRVIVGWTTYGVYLLATTVPALFGFVIDALRMFNPFRLFGFGGSWGGLTSLIGFQVDGGAPGPLQSVAVFLTDTYNSFATMSWSFMLPMFFIALAVSLLLFRSADKMKKVKRFITRLLVVTLCVPICGSLYTFALDAMDDAVDGGNMAATRVVLSTFVDFEGWVTESNMSLSGLYLQSTAEGTATDGTLSRLRDICYKINSLAHSDVTSTLGSSMGGTTIDWNQSVQGSSDADLNYIGRRNAMEVVKSMLTRYANGDLYTASAWEQDYKAKHGTGLMGIIQETWTVKKFADNGLSYMESGYDIWGDGEDICNVSGGLDEAITFNRGCLSGMAMYNYLSSKFGESNVIVYSNEKASSGFVRESHYSVNMIGTGLLSFLYFLNMQTMLWACVIVGWCYAFAILMNSVKRSLTTIGQIPFAVLGGLKAGATVITQTCMLIIETLMTMFTYVLVSEMILAMSGIAEGLFGNSLRTTVGGFNTATVAFTIITLLFSIIFIILFIIMALKLRKAIVRSMDDLASEVIHKFMDVNPTPSPEKPGLLQAAGAGMAAGAGAMVARKIASGGSGASKKPKGPEAAGQEKSKDGDGDNNSGGTGSDDNNNSGGLGDNGSPDDGDGGDSVSLGDTESDREEEMGAAVMNNDSIEDNVNESDSDANSNAVDHGDVEVADADGEADADADADDDDADPGEIAPDGDEPDGGEDDGDDDEDSDDENIRPVEAAEDGGDGGLVYGNVNSQARISGGGLTNPSVNMTGATVKGDTGSGNKGGSKRDKSSNGSSSDSSGSDSNSSSGSGAKQKPKGPEAGEKYKGDHTQSQSKNGAKSGESGKGVATKGVAPGETGATNGKTAGESKTGNELAKSEAGKPSAARADGKPVSRDAASGGNKGSQTGGSNKTESGGSGSKGVKPDAPGGGNAGKSGGDKTNELNSAKRDRDSAARELAAAKAAAVGQSGAQGAQGANGAQGAKASGGAGANSKLASDSPQGGKSVNNTSSTSTSNNSSTSTSNSNSTNTSKSAPVNVSATPGNAPAPAGGKGGAVAGGKGGAKSGQSKPSGQSASTSGSKSGGSSSGSSSGSGGPSKGAATASSYQSDDAPVGYYDGKGGRSGGGHFGSQSGNAPSGGAAKVDVPQNASGVSSVSDLGGNAGPSVARQLAAVAAGSVVGAALGGEQGAVAAAGYAVDNAIAPNGGSGNNGDVRRTVADRKQGTEGARSGGSSQGGGRGNSRSGGSVSSVSGNGAAPIQTGGQSNNQRSGGGAPTGTRVSNNSVHVSGGSTVISHNSSAQVNGFTGEIPPTQNGAGGNADPERRHKTFRGENAVKNNDSRAADVRSGKHDSAPAQSGKSPEHGGNNSGRSDIKRRGDARTEQGKSVDTATKKSGSAQMGRYKADVINVRSSENQITGAQINAEIEKLNSEAKSLRNEAARVRANAGKKGVRTRINVKSKNLHKPSDKLTPDFDDLKDDLK